MADLTKRERLNLMEAGQRRLFVEMESLEMFQPDTLNELLDTEELGGREALVDELVGMADAWELKQLSFNVR